MSSSRLVHVVIGPDPPARLDKALSRDVPDEAALSRSQLARLIADGAVRRDGHVMDSAAARVAEGDRLELAVPAPVAAVPQPQDIPLAVVHEDAALIVVDKPAGMVVHPAPGAASGTLVNALLAHCGDTLSGIGGVRRPGIVHRLDKDTSGLIVAAKTDTAHRHLAAQFEAHSARRRYLALVHGVPDPADPRLAGLPGIGIEADGTLRIDAPLGRHPTDRKRQAVRRTGGRHAVTFARVLVRLGEPSAAALIACRLMTGRTHQIRVHLAHIGHGLIGDPVYGGRRRLSARAVGAPAAEMAATFPRQALHAADLTFRHPDDERQVSFSAPLPADLQALLTALGG